HDTLPWLISFPLDLMTLRLVSVAVIIPLVAWAAEQRDPCQPPPAFAQQFGLTYENALREAYARNERGLSILLDFSTSPDLKIPWMNCYASDVHKLLHTW